MSESALGTDLLLRSSQALILDTSILVALDNCTLDLWVDSKAWRF